MAEIIGRVGWRNFVPTNNPLWDNLLAYWSGDNTANDSKGTYNGTLVNGATYSTGKISNGFSFDGVNDYVNISPSLGSTFSSPTSAHSYSAWVYKTGYTGVDILIQNGNAGMGTMFGFQSAVLNFWYRGGNTSVAATTPLTYNTWTHIAGTYDGAGTIKLYINGTLNSTFTGKTWTDGGGTCLTNIGSYNLSGAFYKDKVDEVGVWSRELTAAEVTELYNAGAGKQYVAPVVTTLPMITTGLVMNLDASNALSYTGTGTSWTDLSGGGNNGTLLNGTSYSSENGGTLVLDGINDYVKINNGTGLNLGNEYTFSIWVKFNNFNAVLAGADMWDYYYLMYVGDSNNIYTSGAGGSGSFSGLNITTNQWVCLTIVRSAASNTLYKNGVYIASGNPSNSGIVKAIGAYASGSFNLNGKISSVNAYNRSLSSTEVTQNFNATKTRFGL